jgi:hypothetical protein
LKSGSPDFFNRFRLEPTRNTSNDNGLLKKEGRVSLNLRQAEFRDFPIHLVFRRVCAGGRHRGP